MSLHILINISSDTENLYGVRFFTSFCKSSDQCSVTLFHICRLDSRDSSASLMEIWKKPDASEEGMLAEGAQRALDRARRNLEDASVVIREMKTKTVQERYGKVRDILSEGSAGLYDAMILGRRATYALQWMFDRPGDEIPQALIQQTTFSCPLWICCDPEEGRKNVLLCVDGSASSMRAADHVGFIVSHTPHHSITVFHVSNSSKDNTSKIFNAATAILDSNNLERSRIHHKTAWGLSVSGAILSEENRGRYAAVAIGVAGEPGNGLLHSLSGKGETAAALINKISRAALWICP
jgi:hypothetical protein